MDVPILDQGLIAVKMSFGSLYNPSVELQLLRAGKKIGESSVPGTNDRSTATIELANHPLGTEARRGDTLRFTTRFLGSKRQFSDSTVTLAYKH